MVMAPLGQSLTQSRTPPARDGTQSESSGRPVSCDLAGEIKPYYINIVGCQSEATQWEG